MLGQIQEEKSVHANHNDNRNNDLDGDYHSALFASLEPLVACVILGLRVAFDVALLHEYRLDNGFKDDDQHE